MPINTENDTDIDIEIEPEQMMENDEPLAPIPGIFSPEDIIVTNVINEQVTFYNCQNRARIYAPITTDQAFEVIPNQIATYFADSMNHQPLPLEPIPLIEDDNANLFFNFNNQLQNQDNELEEQRFNNYVNEVTTPPPEMDVENDEVNVVHAPSTARRKLSF